MPKMSEKICPIISRPDTDENGKWWRWVECQRERCQMWVGRDYSPGKAVEGHCGLIRKGGEQDVSLYQEV